jgi:calpain-15
MDATVTQWRRPDKFLKSPYDLITRIHPTNLVSGKLDDEAFFSVLRNLSTRPPLIERLFLSPTQINHSGVYRLRICKNGEWQSVTIDDTIPCEPISHPKFIHSTDNDLWPMLIEKAYAKLHRCYFSIR